MTTQHSIRTAAVCLALALPASVALAETPSIAQQAQKGLESVIGDLTQRGASVPGMETVGPIISSLLELFGGNEPTDYCKKNPNRACALVEKPLSELDAMYRGAKAGPIPTGESLGAANLGSFGPDRLARFWQGKTFRPADAKHPKPWLDNKTFDGNMVSAEVEYGESLVDHQTSIILDYTNSDIRLARGIRDEIREVAPGLYLGFAYQWSPIKRSYNRVLPFALDFNKPAAPAPQK
ncbi:MAG: hypothetical protein HY078_13815 [Elusimicrobia bacterium]|nr:hypothetical protein [Elusimicrobiota bacterium]